MGEWLVNWFYSFNRLTVFFTFRVPYENRKQGWQTQHRKDPCRLCECSQWPAWVWVWAASTCQGDATSAADSWRAAESAVPSSSHSVHCVRWKCLAWHHQEWVTGLLFFSELTRAYTVLPPPPHTHPLVFHLFGLVLELLDVLVHSCGSRCELTEYSSVK